MENEIMNLPKGEYNGYEQKGDFIVAPNGGWIPIKPDVLCSMFNGLFAMWNEMYVTVNKHAPPDHYEMMVDSALQQLFLISKIPWSFPEDMEKYYLSVKAVINVTRNALTVYGGKYKDWRFYNNYPSRSRKAECRKLVFEAFKKYNLISLSDPKYTLLSFGEIMSLVDIIGS